MAEFSSLNGYQVKDQKARTLLNNKVYHFDSIEDMKGQTELYEGAVIQTLGYTVAGDGGQALYRIRTRQTSDIDDGGLIHVINEGFVAELLVSDVLNVKQFGAMGDSETDDTTTIQNTINAALIKGSSVYVPHGGYKVSQLFLPMFVHFYGDGHDSVLVASTTDNVLTIVYDPDNDAQYLTAQKNLVHDFRINGNREEVATIADSMHLEQGNGIFIKYDASDTFTPSAHDIEVNIRNVWIHGCVGNGVFIGSSARSVHLNDLVISYNNKNGVFVLGTDNFLSHIISHNNEFNGIFLANENNFLSDSKCFRNSQRTKDYAAIAEGAFSPYGEVVVDYYVDSYPYTSDWSMRGAYLNNVQAQEAFGNGFIFKHVDSLHAKNIIADGINFSDEWDSGNPRLDAVKGLMPKRNGSLIMEKCYASFIDFSLGNFLFYPPDVLAKILKIDGSCRGSEVNVKTSHHFRYDAWVHSNGDGSQRFTTLDEWNIVDYLDFDGAQCQIKVNDLDYTYNHFFEIYGITDSSFTLNDTQGTMQSLYNILPRYCELRVQLSNGHINNVAFPNLCSALPENDGELFIQKASERIVFTWQNCTYDNRKQATYHHGLTTKFIGWN